MKLPEHSASTRVCIAMDRAQFLIISVYLSIRIIHVVIIISLSLSIYLSISLSLSLYIYIYIYIHIISGAAEDLRGPGRPRN